MTTEEINEVTIADVIIETIPFSEPLAQWCRQSSNVKSALKFSNSEYFLPIGAIFTSAPKNHLEDEVIGFIVYDPVKKCFKQDYILNIGKEDKQFVLYTKVPGGRQDNHEVKHIKQFFAAYDIEGGYRKDHHLSLEQLEHKAMSENKPFLAEMAWHAVELGHKGWMARPSQEKMCQVIEAIREEKARKI